MVSFEWFNVAITMILLGICGVFMFIVFDELFNVYLSNRQNEDVDELEES